MEAITVVQAFFLALIQGITEFLPISSSGNLVLFQHWFGISGEQLAFTILVHAASACAIILFFVDRIRLLTRTLWLPVLIGTVPTVLVALFFKRYYEVLFASTFAVSLALLITALLNLGIQYILKKRNSAKVISKQSDSTELRNDHSAGTSETIQTVSVMQAIFVGLAQAISVTPGISRSGSTVLAGLFVGLSRKTAFEFSFLLALPAIGGSVLLQFLNELQDVSLTAGGMQAVSINTVLLEMLSFLSQVPLVVGFITSFVTSYASLWLLKYMMEKATFWWFALYCVILSAAGFATLFMS